MMNNNQIAKALSSLAYSLVKLSEAIASDTDQSVEQTEPVQEQIPAPEEAPVEQPKVDDQVTYTLADLRIRLANAAKDNKRDVVIKLLKEFNAPKLSAVAESDYNAFMRRADEEGI